MVLFGFCETQQTVIPTLLYPCQINRRCKGCKFGDSLQESLKSRATFSLFFNCIMVAERKKNHMEITFLSENLGLVISTNKLKINETESSNLALIRAAKNLKADENKRSWSVQKGFSPLFFLNFG